LGSDDRGRGGQYHKRQYRPIGRHAKKRVLNSALVAENQRTLAEIIERQRRKNHREPRGPDRKAAEMTHIRVERLAAGDGQRDGAQHDKADCRMGYEKVEGVNGTDRREDTGKRADLDQSEDTQHGKPQRHNGTEIFADAFRTALLHHEERDQHELSQRQDEGFERRDRYLEPLHGAQHGNRRRDHTVAVKERGSRQTEHGQDPGQVLAGSSPERQGEEREYSPFTLVVGAHDQQDVFDGDDQHEGPNQARQNAENIFLCERQPMLGVEALAKRVDRACSNVAEDDTERS